MPFPLFNRWVQTVPVNLGPATANLAYENRLIEQAIATRAESRRQQELEEQRIALQSSRASRYAQAQAAATQGQEEVSRVAQVAIQEAEAPRNTMIRSRTELQRLMPGINLREARPPTRVQGPSARRRAAESGHQRAPNVVVLDHDEFGPILPTRQLVGQEIHPGYTGNYEADYAFWVRQVDVEEQRIDALHTNYPVLENYANVRIDYLRRRLYQDDIPPEVIGAELEARHNLLEARDALRTYRSILDRNSYGSSSNATHQPPPPLPPLPLPTLAARNADQIQTARRNAVPDDKIIEKRKAFYDLHEKYNQVRRLKGEEEEEIPEELLCPLTYEYMVDPVSEAFAEHERTYERSNILRAISTQNQYKQPIDPFTRLPIHPCVLLPDTNRKAIIAKYKEKMLRYINEYDASLWVSGVRPSQSNLASGKKFRKLRKLRKLRQSVKKRKSKQAKQTKHANRRHAKLSKKYKKQYTKRRR